MQMKNNPEESSNTLSASGVLKSLPVSSVLSAVAALGIAIIWFFKEPGFEPLLAILAGFVAAGGLKKVNLSVKVDLLFAVAIMITSVAGGVFIYRSSEDKARNHSPTIHNIIINRTILAPGETATITVEATDMDGDPLSYIWSAGRGYIPGGNRGPQITYTAPMNTGAGLDTIRVIVSDGKGGSSTQELTVAIENQD